MIVLVTAFMTTISKLTIVKFSNGLLQFLFAFTTILTFSPNYVMEKEADYNEEKIGEEEPLEIKQWMRYIQWCDSYIFLVSVKKKRRTYSSAINRKHLRVCSCYAWKVSSKRSSSHLTRQCRYYMISIVHSLRRWIPEENYCWHQEWLRTIQSPLSCNDVAD